MLGGGLVVVGGVGRSVGGCGVGVGGDLLDDGHAGLGIFDVVVGQDDGGLGCGLGGFLGGLSCVLSD